MPGHRIRIEISSSAYHMFNPNQNTGNPIATDVEWRTASQSIFHDTNRPSALVLPVYSETEVQAQQP
ncbi:CocE/NonD family hydrolase C-terminal non-catalytic domain-containing protein [Pacificimonas sp. ICDLI1SI03]